MASNIGNRLLSAASSRLSLVQLSKLYTQVHKCPSTLLVKTVQGPSYSTDGGKGELATEVEKAKKKNRRKKDDAGKIASSNAEVQEENGAKPQRRRKKKAVPSIREFLEINNGIAANFDTTLPPEYEMKLAEFREEIAQVEKNAKKKERKLPAESGEKEAKVQASVAGSSVGTAVHDEYLARFDHVLEERAPLTEEDVVNKILEIESASISGEKDAVPLVKGSTLEDVDLAKSGESDAQEPAWLFSSSAVDAAAVEDDVKMNLRVGSSGDADQLTSTQVPTEFAVPEVSQTISEETALHEVAALPSEETSLGNAALINEDGCSEVATNKTPVTVFEKQIESRDGSAQDAEVLVDTAPTLSVEEGVAIDAMSYEAVVSETVGMETANMEEASENLTWTTSSSVANDDTAIGISESLTHESFGRAEVVIDPNSVAAELEQVSVSTAAEETIPSEDATSLVETSADIHGRTLAVKDEIAFNVLEDLPGPDSIISTGREDESAEGKYSVAFAPKAEICTQEVVDHKAAAAELEETFEIAPPAEADPGFGGVLVPELSIKEDVGLFEETATNAGAPKDDGTTDERILSQAEIAEEFVTLADDPAVETVNPSISDQPTDTVQLVSSEEALSSEQLSSDVGGHEGADKSINENASASEEVIDAVSFVSGSDADTPPQFFSGKVEHELTGILADEAAEQESRGVASEEIIDSSSVASGEGSTPKSDLNFVGGTAAAEAFDTMSGSTDEIPESACEKTFKIVGSTLPASDNLEDGTQDVATESSLEDSISDASETTLKAAANSEHLIDTAAVLSSEAVEAVEQLPASEEALDPPNEVIVDIKGTEDEHEGGIADTEKSEDVPIASGDIGLDVDEVFADVVDDITPKSDVEKAADHRQLPEEQQVRAFTFPEDPEEYNIYLGEYKGGDYHEYNPNTYFDLEAEMKKYRMPQPSALDK